MVEEPPFSIEDIAGNFIKQGWKIERATSDRVSLSGVPVTLIIGIMGLISSLAIIGSVVNILIIVVFVRKARVEIYTSGDNQIQIEGSLGKFSVSSKNYKPLRVITSKQALIRLHIVLGIVLTILYLIWYSNAA